MLEEAEVRENIDHVHAVLGDMLNELDRMAIDWASWDDSYAFVEDTNQDYIDSNLTDDALASIHVNMIAFVRPSGEFVYLKGVDLVTKKGCPPPADFTNQVARLAPLLFPVDGSSNGVKGVMMLAQGPMLLAERPILTSQNKGPSRGALIFARFLSESEIAKISRYVEGTIEIQPLAAVSPDPELTEGGGVLIRIRNERQIDGYAMVNDMAGQPALVIHIEIRRSIHANAIAALKSHTVFLLVLSAVCGLVLYGMINGVMLRRVSRMSRTVDLISVRGVADTRLMVEGRDELSNLTIRINRMLDALKQADEAVRASETRLRQAMDATHEGLWEWNLQAHTSYFSPRCFAMLGYAPGEVHETSEAFMDLLHPDDRELVRTTIRENVRKRINDYRFEFRLKHKLGRWCWIRSRGNVVEWAPDGSPIRLVGTNDDITESKQAEAEIRRLNEQLEQRVRERTAQLEEANRHLESFNYSVSHDLRAPLRAIDGFSQMVIEECRGKLSEDVEQNLARIRAASQRMACLIDSMLSLSRLSSRELHREDVDLSQVARTILQLTLKKDPHRNVSVVIEDGLKVKGDADLLRIVLENLMENSWKFTSKREEATIEFGMMKGPVPRMPASETGKTVFFIRDNGSGFDMAYANKLFGLFQRLHTQAEFEGMGIGLATVQKIIRRHGGEIWAEGEVGKGATFYFTV